jgi:hypothetical protein
MDEPMFPKPKKKGAKRGEGNIFGNKFNNRKVTHYGVSFASKLEASVYDHLKLQETKGIIYDLRCQDIIYMTKSRIGYRVDFSAISRQTGERRYYEAKGYPTDVWKIKRRLWVHYGPGTLEVWGGTWIKPKIIEQLQPESDCPNCRQVKEYKDVNGALVKGPNEYEDNDND